VFTTVGRIRQKIEPEPSKPRYLLSCEGGYRFVAPSQGRTDTTLPTPATPFLGRARELHQVLSLLRGGARMVSLLGPGGIGKTRLAIECARSLHPELGGAVYFLALQAIDAAPALVRAFIADLELRPLAPHEDDVAALIDRLRDRDALLVCDNVEQVTDAGSVFAPLLAACPRVRLLVTSRVRLALSVETAVPLAPMTGPGSGDELESTDAGLLVLDRARRARPDWDPTLDERQALSRICRLAEGSPLAIELATAWLRLLEPAEIVRELEAGPDLLRTDSRDVPARHTSIRATLASSFRLLAPESERALSALAVARSPFSRATALALAGAGLRELGQLVDASMIRRVDGGRFAFHPAVRDEALARLSDEQRRACERRHAEHFLSQLVSSYLEQGAEPEHAWLARTDPERADLIAAFDTAVAHQDAATIARVAEAFYRFMDGRNAFAELSGAWCRAKRALSSLAPSEDRDRALGRLLALEQGAGFWSQDDTDFLALLRPLGDEDEMIGAIGAAIRAQVAGQFALGKELGERAIELAKRVGRDWPLGFALSVAASSCARLGELDAAAGMLEQAVGMAARRRGRSHCRPLVHLGEVRLFMGQSERAIEVLSAAVAACRDADDRAFALLGLSTLGLARGRAGLDPTPQFIEAIEEGCAHHIPPFWWSSSLVGLCERRVGARDTAEAALVVLTLLTSSHAIPPKMLEQVLGLLERAREALGRDVALGVEHRANRLDLEVAALALLCD
jgi:predicted ATPase